MEKRRGWRGAGLLMAVWFLAGCGGQHGVETAKALELPEAEVSTGEVVERERMRTQALPGTVHPADQTAIAAKIMATVEEVHVDIGQEVEADEILVTLRADEIVAQVTQAEASLAQLQRNLEREQVLLEQDATTAESVRTLEDEIRVARARLSEARTMESYLHIRSPYPGIITTRDVMRGDVTSPGTPLLTLESKGNLEVHVQVPDSLIALSFGEPITVEDKVASYRATLSEWSPAADPNSRTRLAKLLLPEGSPLRSGQYVRVNWPAEKERGLWMPASAMTRFGQMERVFLVQEGRLELQLVKTGRQESGYRQVLAGLRAGDRVVVSPAPGLRDGQPASIQP